MPFYPLMSDIPWNEQLDVLTNPWATAASFILLVQSYQGVLKRIAYICGLTYWFWKYGSGYHMLFQEILVELHGAKTKNGGETDDMGKHWTLNIAEKIVLTAVGLLFEKFFPDRYWTLMAVTAFLTLFVLGHHLFQLWMQKIIARVSRFNRNMWKWRGLAFDLLVLFVVRQLDNPIGEIIVEVGWWAYRKLFRLINSPEVGRVVATTWIALMLSGSSRLELRMVGRANRLLFGFRYFFRVFSSFAEPSPPQYKYTPFRDPEHIRVILLYPRLGSRSICCSLLKGPHMRLITYEAISYTWGSMDKTEEILVDGCRMKVTKAAHEILASYSSLVMPRLLWIDAICIDQSNDDEKSKQVPMMDKIYRNAIFTTIFLGRSSLPAVEQPKSGAILPYRYDGIYAGDDVTKKYFEDARIALDTLQEFYVLKDGAMNGHSPSLYEMHEYLQRSHVKGRQWAALFKMLRHPWFERVWVVQEVALSGDLYVRYGDEVIHWSTLASGIEKLQSPGFASWLEWAHGIPLRHTEHTSLYNVMRMHGFRESFRPRSWWESDYNSSGWDTGLAKLLEETFYFKANNPRDLIFGVASLCRDPIRVDYSQTVEEVFLYAAKEILQKKSFQVLLHAAGVGNRPEVASSASNLPSWVPDWTDGPKYGPLKGYPRQKLWTLKRFANANDEKTLDVRLQDDNSLALSGVCIDFVNEVGPQLFDKLYQTNEETTDEMTQLAARYKECIDILERSPCTLDPYPYTTPPIALRVAFRRTIVTTEASDHTFGRIPQWETELDCFLPEARPHVTPDRRYELRKAMDDVTDKIKSSIGGRRPFVSRKGYIGLCPPYSKRGDIVYTVPGLLIPVLLRQETFGPKPPVGVKCSPMRYKLVGECYCLGLMDREGMSKGSPEEDLVIE